MWRDSFSSMGSVDDELHRVHFVECMSEGCNNAEFGDTPEDAIGAWNATEPLTIDTDIGLLDVLPGHPISMRLARLLDARCR